MELDQEALVAVAILLTLRPAKTKTSPSLKKTSKPSKSKNRIKIKAPDHNIGAMRGWLGAGALQIPGVRGSCS